MRFYLIFITVLAVLAALFDALSRWPTAWSGWAMLCQFCLILFLLNVLVVVSMVVWQF